MGGTSASIRGKNFNPSELRIVLIGGRHKGVPSGSSSVGNIILGRDVFKTNRTTKSVMRQELVSGRQVSVVDTPGWSDYPLDLTSKQTQLEIQQSVNLCPPGPHAFALVVRLDVPKVRTGMSAVEHVRFLLSDIVWKHTIVVVTVADKNNMRPDLIRSDPELRYITEKCEGRFHVLNISDRGDGSQVTELLQKVDQMVTRNGHYETDVSEELKEKEETIRRKAEQRRADVQKQSTGLPKDIGKRLSAELQSVSDVINCILQEIAGHENKESCVAGRKFPKQKIKDFFQHFVSGPPDVPDPEPEEPTLPAVRRSMSGRTPTPSETDSYYQSTNNKVSDWLKRHAGPISPSSANDNTSEAPSMTKADSREDWLLRDTFTAEECTEIEELTLPGVMRRYHSIDLFPPSMSGGKRTPTETASSCSLSLSPSSDKKVSWLGHRGQVAPSSGYDTMGEATSQSDADVVSVRDEDVS